MKKNLWLCCTVTAAHRNGSPAYLAAVQALFQRQRSDVTAFNNGAIEMIPYQPAWKANMSLPMHNIELIHSLAI